MLSAGSGRARGRCRPVTAAVVVVGAMLLGPAANAAGPIEPIKPIPATQKQDPARVEIGRLLFADARLSSNGTVSCASCHDLSKGGADGAARSKGFRGEPTATNTPTVFNAALNFRQFWNGRADSLEAQIEEVIRNPVEMGSKWKEVVAKVSEDARYAKAFASAYEGGVTQANIQNAIASYERTLLTPDSRFDRYLRGDLTAISGDELAGYAKFKQYGCIACHQGVNVGGNMFQKFGAMADVEASGARGRKPIWAVSSSPQTSPTSTSSRFRACAMSP